MAQPFPAKTTSSATGASVPIALDPTARVTNVMLNLTSNWVGTLAIQGTLDVVDQAIPGQSIFWDNVSTSAYTASNLPDGVMLQLQCPIAGLRLNCSAYTSGTATLEALQMIFG